MAKTSCFINSQDFVKVVENAQKVGFVGSQQSRAPASRLRESSGKILSLGSYEKIRHAACEPSYTASDLLSPLCKVRLEHPLGR